MRIPDKYFLLTALFVSSPVLMRFPSHNERVTARLFSHSFASVARFNQRHIIALFVFLFGIFHLQSGPATLLKLVRISIYTMSSLDEQEYTQDGPTAQRIASVIPYYPFHGIERFYDISGMLSDPAAFQLCTDVFIRRYAGLNIDLVAGLDARGFILGPPIALALKKPFVMIRKKGKLPNAVTGNPYFKEYVDASVAGDELCVSRTAVRPGQRVLVIDDLVATGGTLIAACDLLASVGATVVECACIVELKALGGYQRLQAKHSNVKVWGLISEHILTLDGMAAGDST